MPHWRTTLKLLEKHGMKLVLLALQVQVEECPTSYRNGAKPSLANSIDKEGQQIVPMLTNMWKRIQNGYAAGGVNNLFELREIDQRVERLEYVGVMELASDVQYMLRGAMQFYGFSHETRISGKQETLFPSPVQRQVWCLHLPQGEQVLVRVRGQSR
ncbi:unnamed protein product [Brassica oleracea]